MSAYITTGGLLELTLDITNIYYLMSQIVKSRLDSIAKPDKHYDLKSLTRFPVLAHWEGTAVRQVYSAEKDPDWSVNLKKGIISLFQIQNENGQKREVRHAATTGSSSGPYPVLCVSWSSSHIRYSRRGSEGGGVEEHRRMRRGGAGGAAWSSSHIRYSRWGVGWGGRGTTCRKRVGPV